MEPTMNSTTMCGGLYNGTGKAIMQVKNQHWI